MVGYNLTILDQIAKNFLLLSEAPSYWFTLNTSCDHAFHLSKRLGMDESDYKALAVALPPPPPPLRRSLVGCCVVVHRPILSSHAVIRPSTLSLTAAFADKLSSAASTAATATTLLPPRCHRRAVRH
jgi:hypothetical protein